MVRKRLLKTNFHRSDILIRCTSDYNHWKQNRHPNPEEMQKSYVNAIQSSKFVLCPRGAGLGSIRLFEVMEMGVAPIIIADGWIPPNGPDWHEFAVFVKESEVKNICKIAESHASEYKERGRLARKAWEQYFSDRVVFNRCIEAIEDLQQNRIPTLDKFIFYCYPPILSIGELRKSIMGFLKPIILNLFDRLKLKYTYKIK